jgi:hypothetical protein
MARDLLRELNEGFQDFRATTEDDDGDEHESVTRAFVVPESDRDFAQLEVLGIDGQTRRLGKDSVVTETSRPGVYDVTPKSEWDKLGYASGKVGATGDNAAPTAPQNPSASKPNSTGSASDKK